MERPFIVYLSINTPNLTSVFNVPLSNQSNTNGWKKISIWICENLFFTSDSIKTTKLQYAFPIRICFVLTDNYWSFWLRIVLMERKTQSLFSASFVHYSEVESCAESTYRHELSQLLKIRASHSSGKVFFFFSFWFHVNLCKWIQWSFFRTDGLRLEISIAFQLLTNPAGKKPILSRWIVDWIIRNLNLIINLSVFLSEENKMNA